MPTCIVYVMGLLCEIFVFSFQCSVFCKSEQLEFLYVFNVLFLCFNDPEKWGRLIMVLLLELTTYSKVFFGESK